MVIHLRRGGKWLLLLLLLAVLLLAGYFGVRAALDRYYALAYPQHYAALVTAAAEENGLDANMLFALIKTESGFRPDATSNVGARGLCQIMESTFDWIQSKLGDSGTTYDDMYDPAANIRYGGYLLGALYREFGSYEVALAAYHAGRGAVIGWLGDSQYSADGTTLDRIPIDDTEHYVNKVMKAYGVYQTLYAGQE